MGRALPADSVGNGDKARGIDGAAAETLLQCERDRGFYTQGNPAQTLRVLLKQSQKV